MIQSLSFSQISPVDISSKIPLIGIQHKKSIFPVSLYVALKLSSLSENVGMTVVTRLSCLLEDWMRLSCLYWHF